MEYQPNKFFDARKTREYFEEMNNELLRYYGLAEEQQKRYQQFIDNDTYLGKGAQSAKSYMERVEQKLLSEIMELSQELIKVQNTILEWFHYDVDSADNAVIHTDILDQAEYEYSVVRQIRWVSNRQIKLS